jgi:hypothetical protein
MEHGISFASYIREEVLTISFYSLLEVSGLCAI